LLSNWFIQFTCSPFSPLIPFFPLRPRRPCNKHGQSSEPITPCIQLHIHWPNDPSIGHLTPFLEKLGTLASEEVILELVRSKCLPVLLYGLECYQLIKLDLSSLDFVITRVLMKLFESANVSLINDSRLFFKFLTCVSHTTHVIDIGWTSVRPSVCPSHTGIVSKRLNLSSNCLHCLVAP